MAFFSVPHAWAPSRFGHTQMREAEAAPPGVASAPRAGRAQLWPLVAVVGGFAVANGAAAAAGVRPDDAALSGRRAGDLIQLLDISLLRHQLVESVWHLASQPPLLNLYAGALVHLPAPLITPAFVASALACGLVLVVCSYLLAVELGVPRWPAALVVIVFVAASPALLLYENWLYLAVPSAALLVAAAWALVRYLRTDRMLLGVVFFSALAAVVLLNSTYQAVWLLGAGVLVLALRRRRWRQTLVAAAVPVALVGLWCVKDAAMFSSYTTSDWFGMNLARSTVLTAKPAQIASLERRGILTPLAAIAPFSPPDAYVPRYAHRSHTGVAALDRLRKSNGLANFNAATYQQVSSSYLREDLAYISAVPASYLAHVGIGIQLWLTPPDQYFDGTPNGSALSGYSAFYDHFVAWQPSFDPYPMYYALFERQAPPPGDLSWLAIITLAVSLLGTPVLAWRRRRSDLAQAATLLFVWGTIAYAFVTTSLVEVGENERFAFELGPLPLLATAVIAAAVLRAWRQRPEKRGSRFSTKAASASGVSSLAKLTH